MRIVKLLSVVLIGVMPWLLSCQEGGSGVDPLGLADKNFDNQQAYLEDLWQRSENMVFETVLTADFKPEDGCNVSGVPPSWADQYPDYQFRLEIAPHAINEDIPDLVTIMISVPTLESITPVIDATQAMPIERTIEYEASVLDSFEPAAALTISFHPHLRPSCREYCFFGLEHDEDDPLFYVNDPQDVLPPQNQASKRLAGPPMEPIEDPVIGCATGIELEVRSFSQTERPDRWHVVNGCCGRGGMPIETPCDWEE